MKQSTRPIMPFDLRRLPRGDWYPFSRRRQQELLENQVREEMNRMTLHTF